MWLGHEAVVVITDYDIFRDLYIVQGDVVTDSPIAPIMDMFIGSKYGLVFSDEAFWREQHRFALHTLRDFGFGKMCFFEMLK